MRQPPAAAGRAPAGPWPAARRWLAGRTLRSRLIAGLLTLLALACASVGLVTYAHLHAVLIGQLDTELATANLRYAGCYRGQGGGGTVPAATCAQQQVSAAFTAVVTPHRGVTDPYLAGDTEACHLSAADRRVIAALVPGRYATVHLSFYGDYRMTASRNGPAVMALGLPVKPVTDALGQVALAEIAVFLAALIAAGVIGTLWVGAELRPLTRVAATAARVARLPLSSGEVRLPLRVEAASPGTEIGQLGTAFNQMLGHVEASLARREASESRLRTFAADASHELRTPLAAIRGYAELMRRQGDELPGDTRHALARVESEAGRMGTLLDELLLLARLDAGRPLAADPVDLTRLIIDAASDAQVAAPGHHWQLRLPEVPVTVAGDEQRLRQVLANLLGNAARHTPAGTHVTITLDLTGPDDPAAVIRVTDDGPGIPAPLQGEVFERFVRGEASRSRAVGGSGLGLAIVRAVTAAHGGTAVLASSPGNTTFTITLPAAGDAGRPPP